ncbi:hypothetical protein [Lactiplantibacillus xiangfangensis]|uniref:Uncharacterized protein n=1 Tax=Lactiplantibacillus xiangfangensis TaxID=942150 RepID=A0A0R2MB56_9LACO|nr:hypothetical protein [Lactiplantibacillus xiangfangensis]KRO10997.1 hypothetical protein IV64_GL002693 [Lactiplantibacillus xiangfangensis]
MKALINYRHKPKHKLHAIKLFRAMYQLTNDDVDAMWQNRMALIGNDRVLNDQLGMLVRPAWFDLPEIRDNDDWDALEDDHEYSSIEMRTTEQEHQLLIQTDCPAETLVQTRAYAVLISRMLGILGGCVSEDNGRSWQKCAAFDQKYHPIVKMSRDEIIRLTALELPNFSQEGD